MSVSVLAEYRVPWVSHWSALRSAVGGAYRFVWDGAGFAWAGAAAAQRAEWVGWKWWVQP